MCGGEKIFYLIWGIVIFPLLIITLRMKYALDVPTIESILMYMGGLKVAYAGARGYDAWLKSPDDNSGGGE